MRAALLCFALLASGCGRNAATDEPADPVSARAPSHGAPAAGSDETPASPEEAAPSVPELVVGERRLMGTIFSIKVDAPETVARPAIEAAFDEIARLEGLLSEWQETSQITAINRASGASPVSVGPEAFAVVRAGVEISAASEGAYDLSWAVLHGLYDFRGRVVPSDATLRPKLPLIDYRQVRLDEANRTVQLARRGMAIGTGSIGKGFALDRAGELLRARGIDRYMLYGGGQVQVHGDRGGRPWRVGIQHPREASYFAAFALDAGSVSTSGDYEHAFVDAEGVRWHHILDLETGRPARRSLSVTVVSPDGLRADALSTAIFVLGHERGFAMLQRVAPDAMAVVVGADCHVYFSPGARARVELHGELGMNDRLPRCFE